jgi:hypothetical protein
MIGHDAGVPRSAVAFVLLLVALSTAVSASAGRDPRAEKERLNPRDTALARSGLLTQADLAPGWRRTPSEPDSAERPRCAGWNPDFSAFTITGKAESNFAHAQAGALIASNVEVYATRRQAVGDFRAGAKPQLARCLKRLLAEGFRQAGGGVDASVVSARMVDAFRVGERTATYRVVARIRAGGASAPAYFDVHFFQRGRSIGGLFFTGIGTRVPDQLVLARRVASRLR